MISFDLKQLSKLQPGHWERFFTECYDYLRDYVPFDGQNLFVSGGFFARRATGKPIRDIDVFVNGDEDYLNYLTEEYTRMGYVVSTSLSYVDSNDGRHLLCKKQEDGKEILIDLIAFHEPKRVEYIKGFDFNICQIAMDEQFLYFGGGDAEALDSITNKRMIYTGSLGSRTMERALKYTRLGFELSDTCTTAIANDYVLKCRLLEEAERRRSLGLTSQ